MDQLTEDDAAAVFDIDDLMHRCMGNIDFAQRILARFQETGDVNLSSLEEAVTAENTETVAQLAHRFKGASANAAAPGVHACAAQLEQAARQHSLTEIPVHLESLKQEWFRFVSEVVQSGLSPQ